MATRGFVLNASNANELLEDPSAFCVKYQNSIRRKAAE